MGLIELLGRGVERVFEAQFKPSKFMKNQLIQMQLIPAFLAVSQIALVLWFPKWPWAVVAIMWLAFILGVQFGTVISRYNLAVIKREIALWKSIGDQKQNH